MGWTPDGASVYVAPSALRATAEKVYRVNVTTGKMELWKAFGENIPAGVVFVGAPHFSRDSSAYAYLYFQVLSQAYVVRGLK